jgi:hypothetical protein
VRVTCVRASNERVRRREVDIGDDAAEIAIGETTAEDGDDDGGG